MRGMMAGVAVGLWLAAGCSRQAPAPAGGAQPEPAPAAAAEGKRPKFESELVHTHTIDGGKGSSRHTSTRYDDGKPFNAVENYETTVKGGPTTIKCGVVFVAHRDGKDVYRVTYTVAKGGASETTTREVGYDGKRTVLAEGEYGTLVLQPPAQ